MRAIFAAAVIAASALASAASAEDFTFTVPVAVSAIPSPINQVRVSCAVTTAPVGFGRLLGSRDVAVTLAGGAFNGDVVVAFNANLAAERHLAAAYTCAIASFTSPYVSGVPGSSYVPGDAATRPERFFPLAAGAPFVYQTGELPLP